ncbi:hypothetical protein LCGC14_2665320 [marine sediment metagenome]|uniref:Uncharacterized protein n=1 Tax=marine sediment metagenome TaxID=412755 RepID=A0A0F9CHK9_9ZZZZ
MAKTLGERVARLEAYYAEIPGHLKDIKELQKAQNGRLGALERWQQRIIGAGLLAALILTIAGAVILP